jgi:hypothetical protein
MLRECDGDAGSNSGIGAMDISAFPGPLRMGESLT